MALLTITISNTLNNRAGVFVLRRKDSSHSNGNYVTLQLRFSETGSQYEDWDSA